MINKETIMSVADDQLTLYEWLSFVQETLDKASLSSVSITDEGNNQISFKFEFADGSYLESGKLGVPAGKDGVGISSVSVSDLGHLIVALTDASTIDAGSVGGSAFSIKKDGTTYKADFEYITLPNADALSFSDSGQSLGDAMAEIAADVDGKQAALSTAQLNACNSGVTAAKVKTYDGYAADIAATQQEIEDTDARVAALQTAKQDKLVSGTNIKTINGNSVLGSGNIEIEGGGTTYTAGTGIELANNKISLEENFYPSAHSAIVLDFDSAVDTMAIICGLTRLEANAFKQYFVSTINSYMGTTFTDFDACTAAFTNYWPNLANNNRSALLIKLFSGLVAQGKLCGVGYYLERSIIAFSPFSAYSFATGEILNKDGKDVLSSFIGSTEITLSVVDVI